MHHWQVGMSDFFGSNFPGQHGTNGLSIQFIAADMYIQIRDQPSGHYLCLKLFTLKRNNVSNELSYSLIK